MSIDSVVKGVGGFVGLRKEREGTEKGTRNAVVETEGGEQRRGQQTSKNKLIKKLSVKKKMRI